MTAVMVAPRERQSLAGLLAALRVQFSHVRVFSDSRNVQKRATKSDTSGHCLPPSPSPSEFLYSFPHSLSVLGGAPARLAGQQASRLTGQHACGPAG